MEEPETPHNPENPERQDMLRELEDAVNNPGLGQKGGFDVLRVQEEGLGNNNLFLEPKDLFGNKKILAVSPKPSKPRKLDMSGDSFLGVSELSPRKIPVEQGPKNAVYDEFVKKFQEITANASESARKKLNALFHFKFEGQELEEVVKNLPEVQEIVPSEYGGLVDIVKEGMTSEERSRFEAERKTWSRPERRHNVEQLPTESNAVGQNEELSPDLSEGNNKDNEGTVLSRQSFDALDERVSRAVVEAQPIDVPLDAIERVSATRHEKPIGPLTEKEHERKEKERELREKLGEARAVFAQQEAEYKKEIREKRAWYQRLMSELGASEKQLPELPPKSSEYQDAYKAYIEAKWELKNIIAGIDVENVPFDYVSEVTGDVESKTKRIDRGLMNQAETERRLLQGKIDEFIPEKEKSIILKGLEKYGRMHPAGKLVFASAITATALSFAGAGTMTAALGIFGSKLVRSGFGVGGAMLTGKGVESYKNKVNKKAVEARLEEYQEEATKADDFDAFAQAEAKNDQMFKEREVYDKKMRLAKGVAMAVVGGATTYGTGALQDGTFSGPKVHTDIDAPVKPKLTDAMGQKKPSLMDRFIKTDTVISPKPDVLPPRVEVISDQTTTLKDYGHVGQNEKMFGAFDTAPVYEPVGVELSEKGFIDTVAQLKDSLKGQTLPPAVEKLLAQSPEKVAMDLGLFKPGQTAESALGFKGEQLTLDVNGNITLMHNDGSTNILFDAKGSTQQFGEYTGNKMVDTDISGSVAVAERVTDIPEGTEEVVPVLPKSTLVPEVTPEAVVAPRVTIEQPASTIQSTPTPDTLLNTTATTGFTTSVLELNGKVNSLLTNGVEIATASSDFNGIEDMFNGKMPLKAEYQFDPATTQIRNEYAKFFTKGLASLSDTVRNKLFDYHLPSVSYMGGQIDVFQKGNDIKVFLNGEKIGTTQLIDGGFGHQLEVGFRNSIFGGKTNYEIAFDHAKKIIENNAKLFKVIQ